MRILTSLFGLSLGFSSSVASATVSTQLTSSQISIIQSIAQAEINKEAATITEVLAKIEPGKVIESNLGYSCTSGQLMQIMLIGTFPKLVPRREPFATTPASDDAIHALLITADAKSGKECLIGVQTVGSFKPLVDATSISLPPMAPLSKCDSSVLKPRSVKTPAGIAAVLDAFVKNSIHNAIKSINSKSLVRPAPAYTAGWHSCYFTDSNIESGYSGFLPKGIATGYQVSVVLSKPLVSGGKFLFVSYAKISGKWKVLASGTGP